jgi:hypothetical protein
MNSIGISTFDGEGLRARLQKMTITITPHIEGSDSVFHGSFMENILGGLGWPSGGHRNVVVSQAREANR